jgi:hypothetical protein
MERKRVYLTRHARLDSIPLRLGRDLGVTNLFLENAEPDPQGTENQKRGEIERGNHHALADLWTEAGEHLGRWRLVLGAPKDVHLDAPVVTVLPLDRLQAKSQSEVTSLLKRERETGKHAWLTTEYIAKVLYPLYRDGHLRTVDQLADHIREVDKAPLRQELTLMQEELTRQMQEGARALAERDEALVEVSQLKEALSSIALQAPLAELATEGPKPARQVTDVWRSRTPGSEYQNVGIEAHSK